jgi:hypothetical protein
MSLVHNHISNIWETSFSVGQFNEYEYEYDFSKYDICLKLYAYLNSYAPPLCDSLENATEGIYSLSDTLNAENLSLNQL